MQSKENKIKIDIQKGYYNKTYTEDGITHIVDESKQYPYFEVNLFKRYFDVNDREELKEKISKDLKEIIAALDKEKERE